ncbi:MAG: hypothetical protein RLZZ383_1098 [Pseudomonadota bacterium]
MTAPTRAATLAAAIRHPKRLGRPAVMPYLIGGWPDAATWGEDLLAIADVADAIEVGVPFSDPMADGPVIQRASRQALDAGVTLDGILTALAALPRPPGCPLVLMSYVNPLLALGLPQVLARAAAAHVHGFIVPDLPWEESAEMREACAQAGLALVQLVTPATPDDRLALLTARDDGFVYAVTVNGITGGRSSPPPCTPTSTAFARSAAPRSAPGSGSAPPRTSTPSVTTPTARSSAPRSCSTCSTAGTVAPTSGRSPRPERPSDQIRLAQGLAEDCTQGRAAGPAGGGGGPRRGERA